MADIRVKRAKINITVSLCCQVITILCGFVAPRIMIKAFGSEAYGAVMSITQFLSYVALLDGGIGGVARAALYKPLADNDFDKVSAVMSEIKRFFRIVATVFVGYVLVLAFSFKSISDVEVFDRATTFLLVIIISISNFGQYFIGISNSVLLQASQRSYITYSVYIGATVINTLAVVILVKLGFSLITVKLVSSLIFFMRPVILWLYVKKHFPIRNIKKGSEVHLKQKWDGLGQHLAFFLHSNTDVVILTLLADLRTVSVYSVYNMITSHIQNLVSSFTSGMEAMFGDMLAKKEREKLLRTFDYYETVVSFAAIVMLSTTAVMITPFIKLYTAGITDADYHAPVFALLMVLTTAAYCLCRPYHAITIAAGHFKETRGAAYGEALMNVLLSVIFVHRFGLIGVAVGTLAATLFRFIYYVNYLEGNIVFRSRSLFIKRCAVNATVFAAVIFAGKGILRLLSISNYIMWFTTAACVFIIAVIIAFCVNSLVYREHMTGFLRKLLRRS